MSFAWVDAPEEAFSVMADAYVAAVHRAVYQIMQRRAPEIENWLKTNAIWTDRTGNARQALNVQVIDGLTEIVMLLAHGVDYGFWLEVSNAGRFAVITPAIDHWVPILMADIQALLA